MGSVLDAAEVSARMPEWLTHSINEASKYDESMDEICAALLAYTDSCVAVWRDLGVPEVQIGNVIDAAALFRDRHRIAIGVD